MHEVRAVFAGDPEFLEVGCLCRLADLLEAPEGNLAQLTDSGGSH
jgi:hypothetical protein